MTVPRGPLLGHSHYEIALDTHIHTTFVAPSALHEACKRNYVIDNDFGNCVINVILNCY